MDKELEELKNIFGQGDPQLAKNFRFSKTNASNSLGQLKKDQMKMLATFILNAAAIIYIDFVSGQKIETSRPGFYILLGCTIYYASLQFFLFKKLNAINPSLPVVASIKQLENYKKINQFFQIYGELIYVIVLSFGVYLYIQPILLHLSNGAPSKYLEYLKFIWFAYLTWAFVNTFYLKRKRLKKETAILEKYINQLGKE